MSPRKPRKRKSSASDLRCRAPEGANGDRRRRIGTAPRHVAIIMDGNGRWAKKRGLPRVAGHRAGAEAVRRTLKAAVEHGVEVLTLYAFSSENWRRPEEEVSDLKGLLRLLSRAGTGLARQGRRSSQPDRRLPRVRTRSRRHGSSARSSACRTNSRLTLVVALELRIARRNRRRRTQPCRQGRAGRARSGRDRRSGSRIRAPHSRTSRTRPADPHVRARCGCPTSCCGKRPTPSCCSLRRCGRISARRSSRQRCRAIRGSRDGGSAAGERARHPNPVRNCHDRRRALAAVQGGYYFAILVAAAATAMFYEWMRIVRGWSAGWKVGGFFYCLAACARLAVDPRPQRRPGPVAAAVDLHRHLGDRHRRLFRRPARSASASSRPSISPGKTVEGLWGGVAAAALFGAAWVIATELATAL